MRALLAFDKFKDALSARDACALAGNVLRQTHPDWSVDLCPLTDGGEGFAEILTLAAGGKMCPQTVSGPRGDPVAASFGLVPFAAIAPAARARLALPLDLLATASIAVIEMAAASGLALLPPEQRDPWHTTTYGTGELIRAAGAAGAAALVLGVGGSATNDLGLGALAALGLEFRAGDGAAVHPPIPANWARIERIAGTLLPALPPIRIACDVDNPLLGPRGCTAVYGPQKGLRAADRSRLEHASARLALMLAAHGGARDDLMDTPGAGAAGGIAFGLMAAAGARLLPGFALVSAWLDLDARLAAADVVLTGEGRFDASSLSGKGPGAVAARAAALGKPVHLFAGSVAAGLPVENTALHAISPADLPLAAALRATRENLAVAIARAL